MMSPVRLLVPPVALALVYVLALLLAFLTVDMPARAIYGLTDWWNGLLPLACVSVALLARYQAIKLLKRARVGLGLYNPDDDA